MFSTELMKELFGALPDGRSVHLFTLQNANGMKLQVTNYGAKIVSVVVPDRNGNLDNVVLGYKNLEHYIKGHQYLGATVGRVANRIGMARCKIGNQEYSLNKNSGNLHLHGGSSGFDSLLWELCESNKGINSWVEFQLVSPHGDQGYPGTLTAKIRYILSQDNSIEIKMSATTDRATIVNMTNHAYFNLSGNIANDIYKHQVKFFASKFLKADKDFVPTGEIASVDNTVLDLRQLVDIGNGINQPVEPVLSTSGYDQFFILDSYKKGSINKMAEVHEPLSGRVLEVASTLPGMQFYTSNFLNTEFPVSNDKVYGKHSAFCIEPSYFPDAPNHPNFQSISLNTGETYNETIVYKFLTQ
jgi:aldose 1-epimerase